MNIQLSFIKLNALVFALYGLAFMLSPEQMSLLMTGAIPQTPSGLIDVRATYGGLSVAVSAILFLLALRQETVATGLQAVITIMLAMASGRLLGMFVDGAANQVMYVFLGLEVAAALLAAFLLHNNQA